MCEGGGRMMSVRREGEDGECVRKGGRGGGVCEEGRERMVSV